ncbi:MAG: translocation/assembly module TamB domain-containing protein, partial [Pseudomonadota bacterium]
MVGSGDNGGPEGDGPMAGEQLTAMDEFGPPREPAEAEANGGSGSVLKWIGIGVAALVILIVLLVFALDTGPGRRFVVQQLNGLEFENGLDIEIGAIEGSLYGELSVEDLRLGDPDGIFLTAPRIEMAWAPFSYVTDRLIDIERLAIPRATLLRPPALRDTPTDPDAPLIPDIDIDLDRLEIGEFILDEPVLGAPYALTATGELVLADGRVVTALDARALSDEGRAGGDRLTLILDAAPDDDRLAIELDLDAPRGGLVASTAGLTQPLRIALNGKGSWTAWDGRLGASLGGTPLADLDLAARDGTFGIEGSVEGEAIASEGAVARLTSPRLDVDLTADFGRDPAGTVALALRSDALAVDMAGGVDFTRSRLDNLVVEAALLSPGAIAPDVVGRDVRARMTADGAFAAPAFAYAITAEALGFGDILIEDLRGAGDGSSENGRATIPLNLTATRISGLPDSVGGLLTGIEASGTFIVADGRAVSNDLRLSTDRIDATAIVAADFGAGTYTGTLDGQLDDYEIPGVGLADIETRIDLAAAPDGGFALRGPFRVQTTRIDNDTVQGFLGGNATVTGRLIAPGGGTYLIRDVALRGPGVEATGEGRYTPDGRIAFALAGTSDVQGPFTVDISGTADAPVIDIRAERPRLGLQFSDVEATITGTPAGYAVDAGGGTPYGPFTADLLIRPGDVVAIDVRRVAVANLLVSGAVEQTPAGPYAGILALTGKGIDGTVGLSAVDGQQAAAIDARVRDYTLAGDIPIGIRRALVDMDVVLTDAGPVANGSAQIGSLTYGGFRIAKARAEFDRTADGIGRIRMLASGAAPTPYEIAINARQTRDRIVAAMKGEIAGEAFRTPDPIRIAIADGTYRLAPARIRFRQGDIEFTGRYGEGVFGELRFEEFDLGILNAFAPGAGIGGAASGSADWRQPTGVAFPLADMRLKITDFTRSGAVAVSQPVDIDLAAALDAEGGHANAVMRERGRQVGRMKLDLSPLDPGAGDWQTRLFRSPLSGGIRYNGPASALFSLAGLEGQSLTGPLGIAGNMSGRLTTPELTGVVEGENLTYINELYGTRVEEIALEGRFTNEDFILTRAEGKAGDGSVSASGRVGLSAAAGFPVDLDIAMSDAELADSSNVAATVSGELKIVNGANRAPSISGRLDLPLVRYRIVRPADEEVTALDGIRRKPVAIRDPDALVETEVAEVPSEWALDIDIVANNQLFISGMGLESEWKMALNVGGTTADYRIGGEVELIRGTFGFGGRSFSLQRGVITFTGEREPNPQLDIVAETEVDDVTAMINIGGRAYDPRISFSSQPARPEEEILSLILFGGPPAELGALEAVQLAASLNSLRGSGGGFNPLNELRNA